MPNAGDQIVISEHESITFLKTSSDTDGELLEVRVRYKPRSEKPPAHFHPLQKENFEVLQGKIRAQIGGKESIFNPGDAFRVPVGAVHWMHNIADTGAELLWQITPALRTEDFFAAFWTLNRERAGEGASENILQVAVLLSEFYDEFRLAKPPWVIQRVLFGFLGPIGRILGYRTSKMLIES